MVNALSGRLKRLEREVGADEDDEAEVAHWARLFASLRCYLLEEGPSGRSNGHGLNCPYHGGSAAGDHDVEVRDLDEARGLLRAFRRQGIEPSMMGLNLLMNQPE